MDEKLGKELDTLAEVEDYQGIVDLLKGSLVGEPSTLEEWLVPSLIKLGQYTEAEVELEQLSEKDTGTWWYLRSWIYYEQGNLLDAREAIEKAELLRQKEREDPIDSPDESLDFQMDELESMILCDQFRAWGVKRESKKIVDTILAFPEEKRNDWAYWLASAYENLQEWTKAEALLLSKINQGDGDPWNCMMIGEIIHKQGGRDVEALSYLRQACAIDSEYDEEEYLAKWMSERIGRWYEDKEYQKIVDAVTEFEGNLDGADAYYYIDSLIKLDRKTEAEEAAYALESEAHGEDTSWYEAVIRCWGLFGHTGHALRVACTLEAEARWEDASWCLAIVQLWYKLSSFSRTLSLALKAKKLFPEEAAISVYLIDSLIQLDRKTEAEKAAHALEAEARWDDWFWCLCVAQAWSILHCPANVMKIAKKAKKLFPDDNEVFEGYINCPVGYLIMHESDKVKKDAGKIPKDADTVSCESPNGNPRGLMAVGSLLGKRGS